MLVNEILILGSLNLDYKDIQNPSWKENTTHLQEKKPDLRQLIKWWVYIGITFRVLLNCDGG